LLLSADADFKAGRYAAALRSSFLGIDELLKEELAKRGGGKKDPLARAGCAALVVLRVGRELFVAWAGDARAVHSTWWVALVRANPEEALPLGYRRKIRRGPGLGIFVMHIPSEDTAE
jgi:hypothetical protein